MKREVGKRSPMYVSIDSRLLGVVVTVFILILTVKSELLTYPFMTFQLVLSIPFFLISMLSDVRIINEENLRKYKILNRLCKAFSLSLVINALGLLVSKYVSLTLGISFFVLMIFLLGIIMIIDYAPKKLFHEGIMILLIIILGILPARHIL